MGFDLHVHTTASDGTFTPSEIVRLAVQTGLKGIAITDHDTLDGIEAAKAAAGRHPGFEVISGIELNTDAGEREVHILGYLLDWRHAGLAARLAEIKTARENRAQKMVEKLREMGYQIEYERVRSLAQGDIVARPHVAQALLEKGYIQTMREAFDQLIGLGRPAYVKRYKFLPEEAIALIRDAGGVPVLAHPGLIGDPGVVLKMIDLGISGLEVYYPEHRADEEAIFLQIAREHRLVITGGSDFHGQGGDMQRLGLVQVDSAHITALKACKKALEAQP